MEISKNTKCDLYGPKMPNNIQMLPRNVKDNIMIPVSFFQSWNTIPPADLFMCEYVLASDVFNEEQYAYFNEHDDHFIGDCDRAFLKPTSLISDLKQWDDMPDKDKLVAKIKSIPKDVWIDFTR